MAQWRSNIPELIALLKAQRANALIAATQVLINRIKADLAGGYTTGDYVTGLSVNSVTALAPEETAQGMKRVIGTNLDYNLFWELGHHNLFTRRYERVPKWVPAFEATRDEMGRVFARYMGRQIEGMGAL